MGKKIWTAAGLILLLAIPALPAFQAGAKFTTGPIAVKNIEKFFYYCLPQKGPFTKIGEAIGRLMEQSQIQNVWPGGPMVAVYYNSPDLVKEADLEWELGFPTTEQAMVQDPIKKKQWIFTMVAACVHQGPYDKLGESIIKIVDWIKANGYVQNGPILETYLDMNPQGVSPESLKTEIWIPIQKK